MLFCVEAWRGPVWYWVLAAGAVAPPREDRNFGARNEGFAPRPDFANRKPGGFAKPAGKVFVPRDAAKKSGKFSKPARD